MVLIVTQPRLSAEIKPGDEVIFLKNQLTAYYKLHLLQALISALGGKMAKSKINYTSDSEASVFPSPLFTRDMGIAVHPKKVIFIPGMLPSNRENTLKKSCPNYAIVKIPGVYFEGGNAYFCNPKSSKEFILLGDIVESSYAAVGHSKSLRHTAEIIYRASGIEAIQLEYNQTLKDTDDSPSQLTRESWGLYYYHLDNFIIYLPDEGKLILLSDKILSSKSYKILKEKFGDDLINLNYQDVLTKPLTLNSLALNLGSKKYLIINSLPSELLSKIESATDYELITPEKLIYASEIYDTQLANKVALELQKEGFSSEEITGQSLEKIYRPKNGKYSVNKTRSMDYESQVLTIDEFNSIMSFGEYKEPNKQAGFIFDTVTAFLFLCVIASAIKLTTGYEIPFSSWGGLLVASLSWAASMAYVLPNSEKSTPSEQGFFNVLSGGPHCVTFDIDEKNVKAPVHSRH